jgi:hypothetical protein
MELLLGQSDAPAIPADHTDRRYLARPSGGSLGAVLRANAFIQCTVKRACGGLSPDSAIKPSAKAIRIAAGGEPPTFLHQNQATPHQCPAAVPGQMIQRNNQTASYPRNHPCPRTPPIAKRYHRRATRPRQDREQHKRHEQGSGVLVEALDALRAD